MPIFVLGEHVQVHADLRELGVVPEWADCAATFRISPASLARVTSRRALAVPMLEDEESRAP
jgi:hypothetical protein